MAFKGSGYHEIRGFSKGPMCPLPYDNRLYLRYNRKWMCQECGKGYVPDPDRINAWIYYEHHEVDIPSQ